MINKYKGFAGGLVLALFVLIPVACRSTQKPAPPPPPPPPVAAPVAPEVPTKVEQPKDFVREEAKPAEEVLPTDLDQLNKLAQERGYIKDAFFGFDESTLTPDAQAALTSSAGWLKQNKQYNLLVEGHCDERGTEQYNLALGDRRANTAKQYLVTLGVDSARIRTVSYGEERPFDSGHDEAAWAKNRRAHLVIVGK